MLGACVSTQVMPVAPNVVQINTQAKGLLYAGKAVPETMTAAIAKIKSNLQPVVSIRFLANNSGLTSKILCNIYYISTNS